MSPLDEVEFADNPDPRVPVVLVLDTSGSMAGNPIAQLNAGIKVLKDTLSEDVLASRRAEIAVLTFGDGGAGVVQDFVTAGDWAPVALKAGGTTPMGEAIHQALDMVADRKQTYVANSIQYYRPWVMLITDGAPTDEWLSAAQRVHAAEQSKAVAFFAIGVESADMGILGQISTRDPIKLQGLRFEDLFLWLSESTKRVSASQVGQQVALPPPTGWAQV